jgi:hypothetical protein
VGIGKWAVYSLGAMPNPAHNSVLGRCPTCGRLVTVPASARSSKVACPVCQHQAPGSAFAAEAPLPVTLVAEEDRAGSRPVGRSEPATIVRSDAFDDARTHLLLDVPCIDEAPVQVVKPSRSARGESRTDGGADARTHLLLNAADLQDDEAAAEPVQVADARTRLLLGPLSLPTEQKTPVARGAVLLSRVLPLLLRLSVWLDEALYGREVWARAALALAAGLIGPSLDYLWTGGRSTLGLFTWASVAIGFGALVLARLNGLRSDEGGWDPTLAGTRVRTWTALLFESLEKLPAAPLHVRLSTSARALALAGMSGLIWAGLLSGVRLVFGSPTATTALPFLSGSLLLIAAGLELYAARVSPRLRFSLEEAGNSLSEAAESSHVIDLAEPLPERFMSGATKLQETMIALSLWRPRSWPDEASYRAALERHLERCLPSCKIEGQRWVGRSRRDGVFDLVVDGVVVIGVKCGFYEASAERAVMQMRSYARIWSGKPMILALFDTPSAALVESPTADALAALHAEFALLSVRMPTAH